jgi:flagellar biosynthesis/type III secretory pathway M-ring protein FliF/YscJ
MLEQTPPIEVAMLIVAGFYVVVMMLAYGIYRLVQRARSKARARSGQAFDRQERSVP